MNVPVFGDGYACNHCPDSGRDTARSLARSLPEDVWSRAFRTVSQAMLSQALCPLGPEGIFKFSPATQASLASSMHAISQFDAAGALRILPARSDVLWIEDKNAGRATLDILRVPKPPNLMGKDA
ncbi:uncharacterized protein LOC125224954 [Leguminivora glycinivorella]|uniref:uncharacterized protein LOC125224954 n=1 Tax=Leguminivora glycinivorella TaxID=1035111 RepID=UPI00200F9E68|nr:uncharacterized protein LOC125224954 [Leguminivora glycinivorella]